MFREEDAVREVAGGPRGRQLHHRPRPTGLLGPREESVFYCKWEGKLGETLSRGVTSPDLHDSWLFGEGPGWAGVEVRKPVGRGCGDKSWPERMGFWSRRDVARFGIHLGSTGSGLC